MTDPLEGVTDAHLQAALDAAGHGTVCNPEMVRNAGPNSFTSIIAHARQIAANEKKGEAMRLLAAELAEERLQNATLRAKYEPETVDELAEMLELTQVHYSSEENANALRAEMAKRGMEMQPAPFTREQAERIARKVVARNTGFGRESYLAGLADYTPIIRSTLDALTTPRADLLAMLGDG